MASPSPQRINILLRAFRALMPHDEQFIDKFSEHSRLIVPAAEALRALMSGDGRAQEHAGVCCTVPQPIAVRPTGLLRYTMRT